MNKSIHILISPNSFKGSLNALEVADAIEKGFKAVSSDFIIYKLPIADGGDYTAEVLINALGGSFKMVDVVDPLSRNIKAKLGITANNTAVIEYADASGIKLLQQNELNVLMATSYGMGQLIKAALNEGCKKIIMGLGGSATVEAGAGMLQALGVKLIDRNNNEIGFGGGSLRNISRIDTDSMDKRLTDCEIITICDVDNPLLGPQGAAAVFASQKGADKKQVKELERNLAHFADIVEKHTGKDIRHIKYGAAAGGVAAGCYAFFNTPLNNGIDMMLDIINFQHYLEKSDIVITGEGKIDVQTLSGKAPYGVAVRAKKAGKPVIALAGQVDDKGTDVFDAVFCIVNRPMSLDDAISKTPELLCSVSKEIAKLMLKLSK